MDKDSPAGHNDTEARLEPAQIVIDPLKEHLRELDALNAELGIYINELGDRTSNRDIIDLKHAEEALKLTQASVDLAANEIIWISPEGKIVYLNEAVCKTLQRSRDEILGMYVWDIHPEYTREKWREHWLEIKKRGSFTFETIHYTKRGSEISVEVSVNYVRSDSKEFNFAYIKDITERKRAEKALRVSEERLRRASHAGRIGLFEWNVDRKLAYLCPEAYELYGIDPGSVGTYETWLPMVHPDDRETIDHAIAEAREKARNMPGTSTQIEFRFLHPEGTVLWLLATATGTIEGGDLIVRGAVRDITERKRMEEALRESEEKLRLAIDGAQIGMWDWNIEADVLVWSDRCKQIVGISKDAALNYGVFLNAIHPDDRERINRAVKEALDHREDYDVEMRIPWHDGTVHWAACRGRGLYDNAGKAVRMIGMAVDITDPKRAVEALRVSEERLRRASRAGHIGLYELNEDQDTVYLSPEAYKLVGCDPNLPVTFDTWLTKIHPDDREMFRHSSAEEREEARNGSSVSTQREFRVVHEDGSVLWLLATAKCNIESGDLIVRGAVQDITARKRVEKELADAKAQAELYVDLMGHDINNLNLVARGYLELIDSTVEDEKLKELITKPMEAIDSSSRLIQNVQKLQREKSGVYMREVLDLGALVEDVAGQMESAPDRHMHISCSAIKGVRVRADELLRDVFVNLVGNAIKHSAESPHIDIRMVQEKKDCGEYCRVIIDDNGPGIPDDMKEKIFNRLSRGNTKARGSGLGLYLVKSLVESYGGKVWAEDRAKGDYTKGARFVVMLPAVEK